MTCPACPRDRTKPLIDGATVCNTCEHFRAECEARWLLSLPTKSARRLYLDGEPGNPRRKGVRGMRGDAAVKALEVTARKIWEDRGG